MEQTVGFATSNDGTRIAYAVSGAGPGMPLVRVSTIGTHVGLDKDSSMWGHYWRFLGDGRTLVRYDGRGMGLSDREVEDVSLDARVSDLEAVVDGVGLESFSLLGHGLSAPIALEYAVRHPARVAKLIVLSGVVRGLGVQTNKFAPYVEIFREGMGTAGIRFDELLAHLLVPSSGGKDSRQRIDLIRASASPEMAARIAEAGGVIDVSERVSQITAPTLVIHAVESRTSPVDEGRALASLLSDARFVPLETENQVLPVDDPAWQVFRNEVGVFLSDESSIDTAPIPLIEGLSARESDVLRRVADGATDRAIADDLGISVRTVANHMKSILQKTNSASRTQAAVWAAKRGHL